MYVVLEWLWTVISETSVAYIYFVCMLQYIYSIESTVHRLDLEHCKALEWNGSF